MKKKSKRYREGEKLVEGQKHYTIEEAVEILKKFPQAKFDESIELNFQLGIDAKKSDQIVRGSVNLPNGTGKKVKVLCFCKGEVAKEAETAGADYVGAEDLLEKINKGWMDFDIVVAHPDMMKEVSKLGRILGPKGLMPSPKTGTVTPELAKAIKELKKGKIEIKSDKTGGLHVPCGKISFQKDALVENIKSVVKAVVDLKPALGKGDYLRKVAISTTQGPGLKLAISSLLK